jgi:hypothetical protein
MSPRPVPAKFRVAKRTTRSGRNASYKWTSGAAPHGTSTEYRVMRQGGPADQRSDDLLFAILRRSRGVVTVPRRRDSSLAKEVVTSAPFLKSATRRAERSTPR